MKRVVTAIFLVPAAVYSALFAPWWIFLAVVATVACLCFYEYASIVKCFAPLGLAAGLLVLVLPDANAFPVLIVTALAAMCLPLASDNFERSIAGSAALVMGVIYIFGSWETVVLLHEAVPQRAAFGVPAGHHWVMFGLMVNWVGDTGAYYIGKNFGRHKLAPRVSPGKTWEGAVASSIASIIFGLIYLPLAIPGTSLILVGALALAANVAGQFGDLAESALKRGFGVKDSGTMLPGHGGFLDRVDSTMFSLPVLCGLLLLFKA